MDGRIHCSSFILMQKLWNITVSTWQVQKKVVGFFLFSETQNVGLVKRMLCMLKIHIKERLDKLMEKESHLHY